MNAIDLLRHQHREIECLFQRIAAENNRDLFQKLAHKLVSHMEVEEKILYPAVEAALGEDTFASEDEHHEAREIILRILNGDPKNFTFSDHLSELERKVSTHIQKEESQQFPRWQSALDRKDIENLGKEIQVHLEKTEQDDIRRFIGHHRSGHDLFPQMSAML